PQFESLSDFLREKPTRIRHSIVTTKFLKKFKSFFRSNFYTFISRKNVWHSDHIIFFFKIARRFNSFFRGFYETAIVVITKLIPLRAIFLILFMGLINARVETVQTIRIIHPIRSLIFTEKFLRI